MCDEDVASFGQEPRHGHGIARMAAYLGANAGGDEEDRIKSVSALHTSSNKPKDRFRSLETQVFNPC